MTRQLDAFEMWLWREMEKIMRADKNSSKDREGTSAGWRRENKINAIRR